MRAESMALNDQLQVAAVQKEKYGTKDGTLGYATHTMEPGDEEKDPTLRWVVSSIRRVESW